MKKSILLLAAVFLFLSASHAAAVTLTEDFTSANYSDETTLYNKTGGTGDWSTTIWNHYATTPPADSSWIRKSTVGPVYYGEYTNVDANTKGFYKQFTAITEATTFSFNMTISNATVRGYSPGFTIGHYASGIHDGPRVLFFRDANLNLAVQTGAGTFTTYTNYGANPFKSIGVRITVDNIANHTYTLDVDPNGGTNYVNVASNVPFVDQTISQFDYIAIGGASNSTTIDIGGITISSVPEPSAVAFFGMGLLGLVRFGMRKLRTAKA